MDNRASWLLYASITSVLVFTAGCGYPQQSKFQTSFLPAAPHAAVTEADLADPPPVAPNPFLTETPKLLRTVAPSSQRDSLSQRAEQAFQRGRRSYLAKDADEARRQFDTAIDLMLEAGQNHPADRNAFDHRLDEMIEAIHRYDLTGLGSSTEIDEAGFSQLEKAPLEDILQMTFPVDPKLKDKVKEQVQASVSQLPLSVNDAVLGYINYFSGRGHKTLVHGLERAGRYGPLIHRILEEEGIPQELIHLAQAESGFAPRAMSHKAAGGMWQFLTWRGQEYGLKQTKYTDDRFDPEKATRASARHLHDLFNEFGDWYLAIAAYNCGPYAVAKAVERTGYADFWELRARGALPVETTNYVPIILAMTIMDKNAKEYGLEQVVPDPPLTYDTVQVPSPTHLALVADLTDTPLSQLVELNPALLKGIAPAAYTVRVPKGLGSTLITSLQLVPVDRRDSWRIHTVESGETLASIGKRYGTAPDRIVAANRMDSAAPVAGERLIIPASFVEKAASHRASTVHASSRRKNTGSHSTARASAKRKRKGPAVLTNTAYNQHAQPASGN